MAISIDPRPTYFGDRMIVTGTYAATDVTIDLTDLLASIDSCTLTPTAAPVANVITAPAVHNLADAVELSGTTVIIHGGNDAVPGASVAGKFLAIGRRS
jgi:hypothetical protein